MPTMRAGCGSRTAAASKISASADLFDKLEDGQRAFSERDHDALLARITTQLGLKAAGHGLHQGQTGLTPHLASIGG